MNGLKNIMKAFKKMVNNEEIQKYMAYILNNDKLYYDTRYVSLTLKILVSTSFTITITFPL
jgi:hypothetical protein